MDEALVKQVTIFINGFYVKRDFWIRQCVIG